MQPPMSPPAHAVFSIILAISLTPPEGTAKTRGIGEVGQRWPLYPLLVRLNEVSLGEGAVGGALGGGDVDLFRHLCVFRDLFRHHLGPDMRGNE